MIKFVFYDFFGYNSILFFFINKLVQYPFFEYLFSLCSIGFSVFSFPIYVGIGAIFFFWRKYKNLLFFPCFFQLFSFLFFSLFLYILFLGIFFLLKFLFLFPRPYCFFPLKEEFFFSNLQIYDTCFFSFPSGHIGNVTLLVLLFWRNSSFFFRVFMISLILLVGISRIAIAMHFPADVFYGFILACFVFFIGKKCVLWCLRRFFWIILSFYFMLCAVEKI